MFDQMKELTFYNRWSRLDINFNCITMCVMARNVLAWLLFYLYLNTKIQPMIWARRHYLRISDRSCTKRILDFTLILTFIFLPLHFSNGEFSWTMITARFWFIQGHSEMWFPDEIQMFEGGGYTQWIVNLVFLFVSLCQQALCSFRWPSVPE